MRRERFKVRAAPGERFAPSVTEATVTIEWLNEDTAVVCVRPLRGRKEYRRTLEEVARIVMQNDALSQVRRR